MHYAYKFEAWEGGDNSQSTDLRPLFLGLVSTDKKKTRKTRNEMTAICEVRIYHVLILNIHIVSQA